MAYPLLFLIFLLNALLLNAQLFLHWADSAFPLDLTKTQNLSWQILDKDQKPLRFFLTTDDKIRLPLPNTWPNANDFASSPYLKLLLLYEDKHFFEHQGIYWPSLGRALWQRLRYGRIISGGSTITMQTARLLMPIPRSIPGKFWQMFRAWQLEQHFSKTEILHFYLTLAPFGGNIEGITAASFRYFHKSPQVLNLAEAALLVALPQAPEKHRPDRFPEAARMARNKILQRAQGYFPTEDLADASVAALPSSITPWPNSALHLAFRLFQQKKPNTPGMDWRARRIYTCLNGTWQQVLEEQAKAWQTQLEEKASIALILIDNKQYQGRAYLGASDFFSVKRQGQVDLTQALRSPGSTLKPFIYALAMDRQFLHSETILHDRPSAFGGYRPENFSKTFRGRISAREALQQSLNVPAVQILDRLGSENFWHWLQDTELSLALPQSTKANLTLALGGLGLSLEGLTSLYSSFANAGQWQKLRWLCPPEAKSQTAPTGQQALFSAAASESIWQILRDTPPPAGFPPAQLAFKTGTSYGFRDAWTVIWEENLTLGVWTGRADGSSNPGFFGRNSAAVMAFDFFYALPQRPTGSRLWPKLHQQAPKALQFFEQPAALAFEKKSLQILFPKDGSDLPINDEFLILEASGGQRPLRWFVNGEMLSSRPRERRVFWQAEAGFYTISVVDATGFSQSIGVRVLTPENTENQ